MKTYRGGQTAALGVYLNLSTAEFIQLHGDTTVLPGTSKAAYIRVPAVLAAVAGPFIGLAFVIFLPLVGIVGILGFLGYKAGRLVSEFGRRAVQPVAVGWRPGRAYLTRKGAEAGRNKGNPDRKFPNMTITEIEEEITRRRSRGEK